jgi:hypothetical protein
MELEFVCRVGVTGKKPSTTNTPINMRAVIVEPPKHNPDQRFSVCDETACTNDE